MKTCLERLAPLLQMSEPHLVQWLLDCLQLGHCGPLSQVPADYDSPIDYIIDCLHERKDDDLSRRFGDAACKGFESLLLAGEFSSPTVIKAKEDILTNILFLIEALPSSTECAEDFVESAQTLLAAHSERLISNGKSLRARILLSLASKLPAIRSVDPEIARIFVRDLSDADYCIPAYSVILRLNPRLAAEQFNVAVRTLRSQNFPSATLTFEIARVLTKQPDNSDLLFNAVHKADEQVRQEFGSALLRLNQPDLLRRWESFVIPSAALVRSDHSVPEGFEPQFSHQMQDWQPPYFYALTRAIRALPGSPIAVGKEIGKFVGVRRWATQQPNGGFKADEVPLRDLGNLINYLDNGFWNERSVLADSLPVPNWFTPQNRRLVAAAAVRQIVQDVATNWKTDRSRLSEAISQTTIRNWLDDASTQMLASDTKIIRLGVTPFPEDRLFYLVLREAAKNTKGIIFEAVESNYGQPISGGPQPDCYLVNEWADIPQLKRTTADDNIYVHTGYFVFGNEPAPESSIDRFKAALGAGLSHHQGGEFVRMIPEIQKVIGQTPSRDHGLGLQNWADDFQAFITGLSSIYLGASVNSRLLKRVWQPFTSRISVLCEPEDFRSVLQRAPANRLILNENLMKRVKQPKRRAFKQNMIKLYRETSCLIHEMAVEAEKNISSRGGEIIRQFMYDCAPTDADENSQRGWSFLLCAEDMTDLILKDNDFDLPVTDNL